MNGILSPRHGHTGLLVALALLTFSGNTFSQQGRRTVKGRMQERPGAPMREVEVGVHEVPLNPPSVSANEAPLKDSDLVLGLVVGNRAMAYPIRYLALTEILDDHVGDVPIAPSW